MRTEIYSEEHQRMREVLKRERRKAGLRQSDIAMRTGRSQAYVSKFENGDIRLDVIDFVRFCVTIGCDPHEVLDEVFAAWQTSNNGQPAFRLPRD
jgi:transcriptional regulator with XRE-family HTH domain